MKKTLAILLFQLVINLAYSQTEDYVKVFQESVTYFNLGKTDKAIELAEKSAQLALEEDGESYTYALIINKVNFMKMQTGKFNGMEKECLENYLLINSLPKVATATYYEIYSEGINMLAMYYHEIGNHIALDTLLPVLVNSYQFESYEKAIAINSLASHYRQQGRYNEAEPLFRKSLKMYEKKQGKDMNYAIMTSNVGVMYFEMGLNFVAEKHFLEALELMKQEKNKFYRKKITPNIRTNLAYIYIRQFKFDEAEKILQKNKKNLGKKTKEYLHTIYALGKVYMYQKKYTEAEKHFLEVIDIANKTNQNNSQIYSAAYNVLGVIKYKQNNIKHSEEYYLESLKIIEQNIGKNSTNYIYNLRNLANLNYTQSNFEQAEKYFSQMMELTKKNVSENFSFLSEKEKYKHIKQTEASLEGYQNFVYDYHNQKPEIVANLFENMLFYKKLILFNTKATKQFVENSGNEELINLQKEIVLDKQKLANLKNKKAKPETLKQLATQIEINEKTLIAKINDQYPNKNLNSQIPSYSQISNSLKNNEALVEFFHFQRYQNGGWTDTTYYCAMITRQNLATPKLVFLSTEKDLETKLLPQKPNMRANELVAQTYRNSETNIYNQIWKNIEPEIKNCSKIYISNSGLTHNIAFSAIETPENKLLGEKYQISYLTNSATLAKQKQELKFSEIQTALLFGDVKFNTGDEIENHKRKLAELPGTKQEVDSIAKIFGKVEVLSKELASEENFYEKANSKINLLHFATHGFYYSEKQLAKKQNWNELDQQIVDNSQFNSGLFLYGSENSLNNPENTRLDIADGILTAYEIAGQDLSQTKLVVLSACQTGLGDLQNNEGIAGISRAFKIVGADYVIMSLWEVPTNQTVEFMQLFYSNFEKAENIETAFDKTQKTFAQKYKNPYYWAGFVLMN